MSYRTNKTFEDIEIGDSASLNRTLDIETIALFAAVSGDKNPAHMDVEYAKQDIFHGIVGHGMWVGSLFSALLGMHLPGFGTIYLSQTIKFKHPVMLGDNVTASVTVTHKDQEKKHITLKTLCQNTKKDIIAEGEAIVLAPTESFCWNPDPIV